MKRKLTLCVISCIVLIACGSQKMSSDKLTNWTELHSADDSQPIARHEAAFIGVGEYSYLLGGRGIKPVSIYNYKTKKWTQGATIPIELHHFQPFVYKDEIYIAGALTGPYPGETPVSEMYIYNPKNDTWRKGPTIPESRRRGGAGATIQGDKLYLVCGIKDGHRGDHKKWLDVYDFSTAQWKILSDAPRPRDHFHAVITDNKIYAIAGRTTIAADNPFKNTIGEVDVYDVSTQQWTTIDQNIPTQRAGTFTCVVDQEIWVFGGESFSQEPAHSEVEALNTASHKWRSLSPMPVGRHGTGAVRVDPHHILVASGCGQRGGSPELSDSWQFTF